MSDKKTEKLYHKAVAAVKGSKGRGLVFGSEAFSDIQLPDGYYIEPLPYGDMTPPGTVGLVARFEQAERMGKMDSPSYMREKDKYFKLGAAVLKATKSKTVYMMREIAPPTRFKGHEHLRDWQPEITAKSVREQERYETRKGRTVTTDDLHDDVVLLEKKGMPDKTTHIALLASEKGTEFRVKVTIPSRLDPENEVEIFDYNAGKNYQLALRVYKNTKTLNDTDGEGWVRGW